MYTEREHVQGKIVIAKFLPSEGKWEKAQNCFPIFEGASLGNPVIFSYNDKLNIYFVQIKNYWDDAQIFHSVLEDETSNQWSTPQQVNTPKGMMVRHRPLVSGGKIFIPAYDEKEMTSFIYTCSADLSNWELHSKIDGHYIQGDLIQTAPLEWQFFLRAAKENKDVFRALSSTAGKTWEHIRRTELPCPLSGIAAITLSNKEILLCNNHTLEHKRTPLSLSLSQSKGLFFECGPWHIDSSDIELSYPSMLLDSQKNVHIVFTFNRKMIKHIVLPESEVIKRLGEIKC